MLLAFSPQQTTLYDQIEYSGNPASFAWVLPIHGTVDVGLSADVLFDSIDALTTTEINPPASSCAPYPASCYANGGPASGFAAAADGGADLGVTVTKQQNVGPYETVQLQSTDPNALNTWLAQNGYVIPSAVTPVIDAYVTEGFDFLVMKLIPGEGIQAMRPVRVTFGGPSLTLPLRMASVGTGSTVGITIWVLADGRYEPQNFPFFHIEDSELVWDFSTSSSNYTTLRVQHEAALGGKGWEIESSIELAMSTIQNVILSGGQYYGGGFGGAPPSDASQDYLPVTSDDGGVTETADQVRDDDVNALFAGMTPPNVRVTRIRSDITHAAMTADFSLQASADQSELSNVRQVTNEINELCPVYSNCEVVGQAPPGQAAALTSLGGNGGGCVASPAWRGSLGAALGSAAFGIGLIVVRASRRRKARRAS